MAVAGSGVPCVCVSATLLQLAFLRFLSFTMTKMAAVMIEIVLEK